MSSGNKRKHLEIFKLAKSFAFNNIRGHNIEGICYNLAATDSGNPKYAKTTNDWATDNLLQDIENT